jgi:predicted RNA-binding Zn-ribbon protein involved in translation (DUF1610 family)
MGFFKKILESYTAYNQRARETMKITNSFQTSFKCPKCKSPLSQISFGRSIDVQYFCKKCGYEGMAKL